MESSGNKWYRFQQAKARNTRDGDIGYLIVNGLNFDPLFLSVMTDNKANINQFDLDNPTLLRSF